MWGSLTFGRQYAPAYNTLTANLHADEVHAVDNDDEDEPERRRKKATLNAKRRPSNEFNRIKPVDQVAE
ncbi:hypothetical protein [Paraburkholderia guartelaensis]|uniref:hypothetical protein n=1 Tax=Paraburkholderia guartelaensis TaxID=2546446 RepID=UPI002AB7446D|nr:hypothetical protein [Paraburkholderia guartelaensis]